MASLQNPSLATCPTSSSSTAAAARQTKPDGAVHAIQLRYKLSPATIKTLEAVNSSPSRRDILYQSCQAIEFRSFPIKQAERTFFREINDHTAIPYPLGENICQPWQKAFLFIQMEMQQQGWPNKLNAKARKELQQESGRMYSLLDSVLRCMIDLFGHKHNGRAVNTALDVLRSIRARVWEGSGNGKELLQIQGIGPAKMQKLVDADVRTIHRLSRMEFYHIERLLSRNPPFGQEMKRLVANFPLLKLDFELIRRHDSVDVGSITQIGETSASTGVHTDMWIARVVLGYGNDQLPEWKKRIPWTTFVVEGEDGRLVWFWRGSVKRLCENKEMLIGLGVKRGETLKVTFACEEVVGTMVRHSVQVG
ncbi:hypothetical protein S7711_03242 [Stachybotrys chartarum IBT 7711]|uniref:SEC63 domain-containing protein n=1 Tax=Stachybotrys chartarum (strain CBS 109288 / IBT 7711) TaxID=1280523 RepID=A0A084AZL8_STACB|nr:hypothetical protein S7711_03242 [Stachybotrys chartarum IBT 7711]KFA50859.1 hypothetical protein S40293_02413 [Stachybotrys chartarum IBT 40293]KFA76233.1 hypothetical protein S40288_03601 [Stachybotrys chartarum IBT 40288]